ncbi:MAG: hypothetical protein ABSF71_03905 [Terriglobia bacterium]|jgi:hypothetical protein
MKKWLCSIAGLSLALAGSLAAQAQTPAVPPPNILNIQTDNIKPYEDGPYDKFASESAVLSEQLKDPTHVLAMESLTGSPRAIYLSGFDSFEELQKNEEWLLGDAATDAKFDALDAREAPYVAEVHYTIWHYRPDLSNNVAGADIPHAHYWEVIIFHMRSGHDEQFEELTKLYRDAHLKISQNTPWATYEGLAGVTDAYLVLVPMTSLKDQDTALAHKKDFGAALGDEGKGQMNKLSAESVASVEDNIWMVVPEWSTVEKAWIEADPQYWAPKPAAKPAPAPKAPPAQ